MATNHVNNFYREAMRTDARRAKSHEETWGNGRWFLYSSKWCFGHGKRVCDLRVEHGILPAIVTTGW